MARRRYQMGTLSLLTRGWQLRWREDEVDQVGKIRRVQKKQLIGTRAELPTKQLARRAADRMLGRLNSLDYVPGKVATLGEFAETWERTVLPMMKPSTQSSAKSHLRLHLLPALGDLPLDAIRQQTAQSLVGFLSKAGVSRKTAKNVLITLASILRTAREWGYSAGTLGDVRLPQQEVQEDVRCFTLDEATRIIEAAESPWRALYATAAMTGLRFGELLGLRWIDVDLRARVLTVRQSVWQGRVQTPKTDRSVRRVPIPAALAEHLDEHRRQWRPNDLGLLWANAEGAPVCADNLRHRVLQPLLDQLGIARAGFHAFRHLLATELVTSGANVKVAQAQLGHSDVRTTLQIYAHVIGEDHRAAVEIVAERMRPVAPSSRQRLFAVK